MHVTRLRPAKRRSRKPRLSGGINAARKSMNMPVDPIDNSPFRYFFKERVNG